MQDWNGHPEWEIWMNRMDYYTHKILQDWPDSLHLLVTSEKCPAQQHLGKNGQGENTANIHLTLLLDIKPCHHLMFLQDWGGTVGDKVTFLQDK